jgi:hypothetical protein
MSGCFCKWKLPTKIMTTTVITKGDYFIRYDGRKDKISLQPFLLSSFSNHFLRTDKGKVGKAIPGQAQRVPRGWGFHISTQPAHEGGKVVSPTHRPPLPPTQILLILISVRGWVDLRCTARPSEIGIATFRRVGQCFSQPPYRLPRTSDRSPSVTCHQL